VILIIKDILSQNQVVDFLNNVIKNFPNFAAGVIADYHGFPIVSKIPNKFPYKEHELALETIVKNRTFIDKSNYIKVERSLNRDETIKLLILLKRPNKNIYGYKSLEMIIKRQMLF